MQGILLWIIKMGVNHILTVFYTIIGLVGISSQGVKSTILVALKVHWGNFGK